MSMASRSLRFGAVASSENGMQPKGGGAIKGRAALGCLPLNERNLGRPVAKKGLVDKKGVVKPKMAFTKKPVRAAFVPRPVLERKAKRASNEKDGADDKENEAIPDSVDLLEKEIELPMEVDASDALPVEDIDLDDVGNPQMAVDYVNDIYAYMRMLEVEQGVRQNYMETAVGKLSIKPKMRNLLIDWLVEVHQQFSLIQETLYLTVAIIDRYLQVEACHITTKQLQLVGVSAMLVASKYEEMYPPEIGDFVYITDKAYKDKDIREMEIRIMTALNFDLGRPLPINFLRRNSKAGLVDEHVHTLAKYVMELTVVDYRMAHIEPSRIAAASLALSMRLLCPVRSSLRHLWTATLQHYTSYRLDQIEDVVGAIAETVLTIHHVQGLDVTHIIVAPGKKQKAMRSVSKKYCSKKFGRVAQLKVVNGDEGRLCLESIVAGDL